MKKILFILCLLAFLITSAYSVQTQAANKKKQQKTEQVSGDQVIAATAADYVPTAESEPPDSDQSIANIPLDAESSGYFNNVLKDPQVLIAIISSILLILSEGLAGSKLEQNAIYQLIISWLRKFATYVKSKG